MGCTDYEGDVHAERRGKRRTRRAERPDALTALLEYVGGDGSVDYMGDDARKHTRKVRRLVLALLEERAMQGVHAMSGSLTAYKIRAAVLSRPKRRPR